MAEHRAAAGTGTAGMKSSDIILAVDEQPVHGLIAYYGARRRTRARDRLRVQVQHPGDPVVRDLSIELHMASPTAQYRHMRCRGWN